MKRGQWAALVVPEARVLTLVPEGLPARTIERGVYGTPFPGQLVRIPLDAWQREGKLAHRPRLEVWSGDGALLLMRNIPPSVEVRELFEEILWAHVFTDTAEP